MENQISKTRRREEGSMEEEEDRLSQLPENILHHHILSRLPQIDAVRTSILSKLWRYLGPTRPKFEFHQSFMDGNNHKFLPVNVLENNLLRYYDQNHLIASIREFILGMSCQDADPQSIPFLNKWIPIVIMNMGVKTFNLMAYGFSLPPVVFQSEFLEELFLRGCKLDQFNKNCIFVKLQMLKRLELRSVYFDNEIFEKIMSSCPLIEDLVLNSCYGLSTIKVNKARFLKRFVCYFSVGIDSIEIDNADATSLQTISIFGGCVSRFHLHNNNYFFPRLKSLHLWEVHLPTELLNNLLSSNNCPCLEDLELRYCSGFTEFELFSHSIKRLSISISFRQIKATIDAANLLYFELASSFYLPSISFATNSVNDQCKSRIHVLAAWRPLQLHEFLKAFSQSQISLEISDLPNLLTYIKGAYDDDVSCEPLVVEHLLLRGCCPSSPLAALLNCMFRICRPRFFVLFMVNSQLAEWETLLKGETRQCHSWQQDLEESSIQVLDEEIKEWHSGQVCGDEVCFLLKWRDLS